MDWNCRDGHNEFTFAGSEISCLSRYDHLAQVMIAESEDVPPLRQRLIYNGKLLADEMTLPESPAWLGSIKRVFYY